MLEEYFKHTRTSRPISDRTAVGGQQWHGTGFIRQYVSHDTLRSAYGDNPPTPNVRRKPRLEDILSSCLYFRSTILNI